MCCSARLFLLSLCFLLESPGRAVAENETSGVPPLHTTTADKYVIGFGSNSHHRIPTLQLSISSMESFSVSFEVGTLLGFSYEGRVQPNATTNVSIPMSYELSSLNDRRKGISITADNGRVRVHGLNYYNFTTDGFLALPCTSLGVDSYEYYSLMYQDISLLNVGFLAIVGCEDATTVNHGPSTTMLNKMETLYLQDLVDYSGTMVKANKPVSFFSGHSCTNIPSGVRACDHLVEQIPPTAVWGTHFLSASYFSRSSGELYRILTASNSTTVTVNCNTFSRPRTFSLTSAGSRTEFRTDNNSFCSIESNNPLLVMEFTLGGTIDRVGDPFMMMIPSVDQYTNNYVFHSPSEFSNYITILVTPQYYQPEQILVDGVSQENANWAPVHCANGSVCGYCAYVTLEPGDHHVWHSDSCAKISVLMYGFVDSVSYGQPAGIFYGTRKKSKISHSVLEGDPHSVRFTVDSPLGQGQNERTTHYSINCTSESGGDGITANGTGLESVNLTFVPATYYVCSISMSTACEVIPSFDTIQLLTVPAGVEGLTTNVSDSELVMHWKNSVGVVSHYAVTVIVDGIEMQLNVSEEECKFQSEEFNEYRTIEIQIMAVNDAGSGPAATATLVSENVMDDDGSSATISTELNRDTPQGSITAGIIGGSASAVLIFILLVMNIVVLAVLWRKKRNSDVQFQSDTKMHQHNNSLVVYVEGDTELHTYERPKFNPEEADLTWCEIYNQGSTINRARQAVPISSSVVHDYESILDFVEQRAPTTPSVGDGYDYPTEQEIPTFPSVTYDPSSGGEHTRPETPMTSCVVYDSKTAVDTTGYEEITTTPCIAYEPHGQP